MTKALLIRFWQTGRVYLAISTAFYVTFLMSEGVGIYDWTKEIPYAHYIHASIRSFRTPPYFWWNPGQAVVRFPAVAHSLNFVANPETFLFSPFAPLLALVDAVAFLKFVVVAHYAIGVTGAWALARRLGWNGLQFRTYTILFLCSPFILQHIAIGYTPWINLFFFPWLIYFLADPDAVTRVLGVAATLSLVLMQGGSHPAFWFAAFTGLYTLSRALLRRRATAVVQLIAVGALTAALSAVRLYATRQAYWDFSQPFTPGYSPVMFLLTSVVPPVPFGPHAGFFTDRIWAGVPSWDAGIFWAPALVLLVLLLARYPRYRASAEDSDIHRGRLSVDFDALLIASAILFLFAFGSVFETTVNAVERIAGAPWLHGVEKYPFRFALPAMLGFSVALAHFIPDIWRDLHQWTQRAWRPARGLSAGAAFATFELLLALPLIFATAMWLAVAVSVGPGTYGVPEIAAPRVIVEPAGAPPGIVVTPARLVATPTVPASRYMLPGVRFSDAQFLSVAPVGHFENDGGALAVRLETESPLTLSFQSDDLWKALAATVLAWVGTLVALAWRRVGRTHQDRPR